MSYPPWMRNVLPVRLLDTYHPSRQRTLRLFLTACLRRAITPPSEELTRRCLAAVEVLERFADQQVSEIVVSLHRSSFQEHQPLVAALRNAMGSELRQREIVRCITYLRASLVAGVNLELDEDGEDEVIALLLAQQVPQVGIWAEDAARDIYGAPDHFVQPLWRTPDALSLARGIYEDRAWDRMPILADALIDAGCTDEAVLAHARESDHVRGCWLLDGLLDLPR